MKEGGEHRAGKGRQGEGGEIGPMGSHAGLFYKLYIDNIYI
jgi:hypothetical protein